MEYTAARIAQVREEHGPDAIGFLASPLATNEENYVLGKVARAIVGTNNVDSSAAPIARAAAEALRNAFGSEVLPADMTRLAQSKTILVVADDLEASHNVAAVRIKDAVVRENSRLVVVSSLWGELNDFAEVWVRPYPGDEALAVAAIARAIEQGKGIDGERSAPGALAEDITRAADIITDGEQPLSLVYGLPHLGAESARSITAALANIAVACGGADAGEALFVLPQEANAWGMRDLAGGPDMLPAYGRLADERARADMQRLWGAQLSTAAGLGFEQMLADGQLKALVVMSDNPLMLAPGRARIRTAVNALEFLAVIDSLPTDTAKAAHVVLAGAGPWAKEGTTTSADRRILRLNPATAPQGEARQGWRILSDLGARLVERLSPGEIRISYQSAAEIMEEIAQVVPLYANATYRDMDSGAQQAINGLGPKAATRQRVDVPAPAAQNGGYTLTATRGLYTSYEAAAIHHPDADRLHREDVVQVHPSDAAALGITQDANVVLRNAAGEVRLRAAVTETVQPRTVHAWLPYAGAAVLALFEADAPTAAVEITPG
jgi:predicted molibdopterin-dependent oxidoreductase YjgC